MFLLKMDTVNTVMPYGRRQVSAVLMSAMKVITVNVTISEFLTDQVVLMSGSMRLIMRRIEMQKERSRTGPPKVYAWEETKKVFHVIRAIQGIHVVSQIKAAHAKHSAE
jgi:hypothetical protein